MKTRNVILIVVLLLVVAVGGGAWWFLRSLDDLVKSAINKWGPEMTGVAVKVDSVKIEVAAGKGTIRGLLIGNPKGYQAPHALKVGEISLVLDPGSVTKDVVVVKELLIASPDVVYERGPGGDNLSAIQKHIDGEVARLGGGKGAKKSEPAPSSSDGKKFVIDNLYVRDAKIKYSDTVTLPMPDLHLRDVGKASNGASAGEITRQVWGAIAGSAGNLASRAGTMATDGVKSVTDSVRGLLK